MEVYLIRHTAVQAPGLCYGYHDVPLADTFSAEVAQLQAKLSPAPAAGYQVFSSPALRCRLLAETLTPNVILDERLRELHFGTWENRLWNDLPPAETAPWMADYITQAPPQGETFVALQQRVATFFAELAAEAPRVESPLLVVTHGGPIRALVCHCLQIPLQNAFQLRIDFASVTQFKWQYERWHLTGLNK